MNIIGKCSFVRDLHGYQLNIERFSYFPELNIFSHDANSLSYSLYSKLYLFQELGGVSLEPSEGMFLFLRRGIISN